MLIEVNLKVVVNGNLGKTLIGVWLDGCGWMGVAGDEWRKVVYLGR